MNSESGKAISIGIIGCGYMGGALVRGLASSSFSCGDFSFSSDSALVLYDAETARAERLADECRASQVRTKCAASLGEAVDGRNLIIVCVKPKDVPGLLNAWQELKKSQVRNEAGEPLVASVAAGVSISEINKYLTGRARVARVMPNTACSIGMGVSAVYAQTSEDSKLLERVFSSVGIAVPVDTEVELDAVTGLSASGIAFVFCLLEALADGGVKMGLTREKALKISGQTVLGAADMLLRSGLHPAVLKDQVTSPGGTTISGLHELEKGGFRGLLISAVEAAARRAGELGAREQANRD